MQKETKLIESLINEDGNFCSNTLNTPLHDISSWTFDDLPLESQPKLILKKKNSSLPPVNHRKKSRISAEILPTINTSPKKELTIKKVESILNIDHANANTSKHIKQISDENKQDNVIKLNELNKKIGLKKLGKQMKLRPLKKLSRTAEEGNNGDHRIILQYPGIEMKIGGVPEKPKKAVKKMKTKYPKGYYDKFFVDGSIVQASKNQFEGEGKDQTTTESEAKFSENVKDFLKNIYMPTLRSRSNVADKFIEKITGKNKFFLSPILRGEM